MCRADNIYLKIYSLMIYIIINMSEQETRESIVKSERSKKNATCRLSYECLMSSTKSFVHNFSSLTDTEKVEFKSLETYVKHLQKCITTIKNLSIHNTQPNKVVLKVNKASKTVETETLQDVSTDKTKKQRSNRKKVSKEVSPTALMVEQVGSVQQTELVAVKEEIEQPLAKPVQLNGKKRVQMKNSA